MSPPISQVSQVTSQWPQHTGSALLSQEALERSKTMQPTGTTWWWGGKNSTRKDSCWRETSWTRDWRGEFRFNPTDTEGIVYNEQDNGAFNDRQLSLVSHWTCLFVFMWSRSHDKQQEEVVSVQVSFSGGPRGSNWPGTEPDASWSLYLISSFTSCLRITVWPHFLSEDVVSTFLYFSSQGDQLLLLDESSSPSSSSSPQTGGATELQEECCKLQDVIDKMVINWSLIHIERRNLCDQIHRKYIVSWLFGWWSEQIKASLPPPGSRKYTCCIFLNSFFVFKFVPQTEMFHHWILTKVWLQLTLLLRSFTPTFSDGTSDMIQLKESAMIFKVFQSFTHFFISSHETMTTNQQNDVTLK